MATNCEACGYRTNEIKSGTGIEPRGVRFEVAVSDAQDFNRDILKVSWNLVFFLRIARSFRYNNVA